LEYTVIPELRSRKRVLVADGTVSSRDLLRLILEGSGYEVAEAEDEQQVLDLANEITPDLMIIDLNMPKLNGRTVATTLRKQFSSPIVALTAALSQTFPDEISEAGFSAYLVKPLEPCRLRQCVARLLDDQLCTSCGKMESLHLVT